MDTTLGAVVGGLGLALSSEIINDLLYTEDYRQYN